MRWYDRAISAASAVQTLTMPVATLRVLVASRIADTCERSAGGEPPCHTVSYPSDSRKRARSTVSTRACPKTP
jgi:hypothetical protein